MLNVLFVNIHASGGGAETSLKNLMALARSTGSPLHISALSKQELDAVAPLPKLRSYLRFVREIRSRARQHDVVVAGLEGVPFLLCRAALLGLRAPKLALWLHCSPGGYLRYQGAKARLAIKSSLYLARNIICAAPAQAVRLATQGKHAVYLPNLRAALPDALLSQVAQVVPQLVFIGSLAPLKQPEKCIALLAALRHAGSAERLDIFGSGVLAEAVATKTRDAGLLQAVTLHGFVADPWQAVPAGSILLLPSLTEAMPMVILEAFERGCVVIANTFDGHAFFGGHEGMFLSVDFSDISAVVRRVRSVQEWKGEHLQARLANSRAFLRAQFDNRRSIAVLADYLGTLAPTQLA